MKYLLALLLSGVTFLSFSQSLELINSPYDEFNPIMSPDQQMIYFTRAHHPGNIGGQQDLGDIWYSARLDNGGWGPPVHGGNLINNKGMNSIIGFNNTGTMMYLNGHYEVNGRIKTQGFSYSKKVGTSWTTPINIIIPYFKNLSNHQSGWISEDENVLILSAQNYNTRGAEDLYILFKNTDGSWGDAKNIGDSINTRFQEFSPYYSEEDSTLYFSTNGRGGAGSSDVFSSKRLDGSWFNWSKALPLGDTINTSGKDLDFINYSNKKFAILTTTQNSDGYGDIKIHQYGKAPEIKTLRRLFVVNEKTGDYLNAVVDFYIENQETKVNVNAEGVDVSIFAPGVYTISVSAPGFLSDERELTIEEEKDQYLLSLKPIEKGARVVLQNVLFEQSRDKLLPNSYSQLNRVVELLKENPKIKIQLEGHTDDRGSAKANLKLSRMRAKAVEEYLLSKGISKKRINVKGFGGEQPLFPNDSEENRSRNRRVEFVILEK